MNHHTIITIFALVLLCSCNGTRNLVKPDLQLPEQYNTDETAVDSASFADLDWWQFYGDTTLCGFIRRALEYNKDILIASARVEEARLLYGASKADMLPKLSADVYANHESNDYYGKKKTVDPEIGAKLTLSWEADLWKRLSWKKQRSEATYQATAEDRRAMNMIVIASVAEAYFRLLALDSELDIVKRTLATRAESLEMARIRFEGGLTSEMVYRQAEVEYSSTSSLLPSLQQKISETETSLQLLMGRYPTGKIVRQSAILNEITSIKPLLGVPSGLLTFRPDIRSCEMKLRAAMADVGIAYADRFPRFTISLTGGVENDRFARLLQSPFSYVVGSLTSPIFDFGGKKKKYQASIATYNQARFAYEKAVMEAFGEVNDARNAYISSRATAERNATLLKSALEYLRLARIQYEGGTSLYMDVLDAQRRTFEAQIALSRSVLDQYLALVSLYKSLGGGAWANMN